MRTTLIPVRHGLSAAAAAALPLIAAAPAVAGGTAISGITVTARGSTVQVSTVACLDGGTASLMSSGQTNVAQGRQATLNSGPLSQNGSWTNVGAGTYTVTVVCSNGATAGTRSVTVGPPPTISATSSPRGVQGGVGGGTRVYGMVTVLGGGSLVALAAGGGAWYLRRRSRRRRLF